MQYQVKHEILKFPNKIVNCTPKLGMNHSMLNLLMISSAHLFHICIVTNLFVPLLPSLPVQYPSTTGSSYVVDFLILDASGEEKNVQTIHTYS